MAAFPATQRSKHNTRICCREGFGNSSPSSSRADKTNYGAPVLSSIAQNKGRRSVAHCPTYTPASWERPPHPWYIQLCYYTGTWTKHKMKIPFQKKKLLIVLFSQSWITVHVSQSFWHAIKYPMPCPCPKRSREYNLGLFYTYSDRNQYHHE